MDKQQLMQTHRWLVKRGMYPSAKIILSYLLGRRSLFTMSAVSFWYNLYNSHLGGR